MPDLAGSGAGGAWTLAAVLAATALAEAEAAAAAAEAEAAAWTGREGWPSAEEARVEATPGERDITSC